MCIEISCTHNNIYLSIYVHICMFISLYLSLPLYIFIYIYIYIYIILAISLYIAPYLACAKLQPFPMAAAYFPPPHRPLARPKNFNLLFVFFNFYFVDLLLRAHVGLVYTSRAQAIYMLMKYNICFSWSLWAGGLCWVGGGGIGRAWATSGSGDSPSQYTSGAYARGSPQEKN